MKKIGYFLCIILACILCAPVVMVLSGSVMSSQELKQCLGPVLTGLEGRVSWKLLPHYPTGEHFLHILFLTPEFYVVLFNSMKLEVCILLGQLLIAVPGAWAFAVYRFRGRKLLFTLYIVLMLLPFQVTMLSQYLVLKGMHLINTHGAIILPAVFSTLPVFLIFRSFCGLPAEIFEAARVDGAGEWKLFLHIGVPLSVQGLMAAMVLGFLEYWNLIEQPMSFLEDKRLWPLSLYLPQIDLSHAGESLAAAVITLIPAVFVFLLGQDYLEQGIAASAVKQ